MNSPYLTPTNSELAIMRRCESRLTAIAFVVAGIQNIHRNHTYSHAHSSASSTRYSMSRHDQALTVPVRHPLGRLAPRNRLSQAISHCFSISSLVRHTAAHAAFHIGSSPHTFSKSRYSFRFPTIQVMG